VVRPVNGAVLARQFCGLNHLGSDSVPVIVDKAARGKRDGFRTTDHRRGSKTLVRHCEVTHLGHAWSGGDPALRYNAAKGPEASVLLWNFFKRHRRLKTLRPR
jgi:poly(3-hydroxybutyrate) depolymerase